MSRLLRVARVTRLTGLAQVASQQVARSNAASAAAEMMRRRQEREDVEAFLARELHEAGRRRAAVVAEAPRLASAAGRHAGA